jgi:hypothetical protein
METRRLARARARTTNSRPLIFPFDMFDQY